MAFIVVLAASTACSEGIMNEQPEPKHTQAEAIPVMEAEVAAIIGELPEFPGFSSRSWRETPCYKDGAYTEERVGMEIEYRIVDGNTAESLARVAYVDALRELWTEQGYEITWDEASPDGEWYNLEARRDDGVKLWYNVAHAVSLMVQSGCVPASDHSEIQYIPPSGGIIPGGPDDIMNKLKDEIQGYPEEPQEEAILPFEEAESSSPAGMVPWTREPGPAGTDVNPYGDQL
jgi:hypothetical protein